MILGGGVPLTPDEALLIGTRRVTALELAQARQRLAHEGVGYVPPWDELTPDEQMASVMYAAGYLRALGIVLYDGVPCTSIKAVGCPVHGDCRCVDEQWRRDPGCPLHAPDSPHERS